MLAAVILSVLSKCPVRTVSAAIIVVMGAAPLVTFAARQINHEVYALPQPAREFIRVAFERDHCDYELPIEGFVQHAERSYDLFYQWVMRLGAVPSVEPSVAECTRGADAIVLVRPSGEFTQEQIEKLAGFVEAGGGLLILDSPTLPGAAAQPVLNAFGMKISREGQPYQGLVEAADSTTFTVESAWPVGGGDPLARGLGGEVLAAAKKHGKGNVVVATFAERFGDLNMGGTWGTKPDAELLNVYQMEYALVRAALAGRITATDGISPTTPSRDRDATATRSVERPTTSTRSSDAPTTQ